ncbi:hypothetical protein BC936DRAFT_146958 [Jimgerdemannia flammicorona]|uniref:Uncharacterized protein n=1 Tax=Jimgerdemannia flammicorona TaxID=994334 RepID=A0A433D6E4_9FUNG|nr:hypothetical protein BC936DRAFT_146958 [Jimgerdemannia flammicorona]
MPLSHMRNARRAHYMCLQQYLVDLPRTEEAPERAPRVCPGPLAARRGRVPRLRRDSEWRRRVVETQDPCEFMEPRGRVLCVL